MQMVLCGKTNYLTAPPPPPQVVSQHCSQKTGPESSEQSSRDPQLRTFAQESRSGTRTSMRIATYMF